MRIRLYGAQLTPGNDPLPYVKTTTPQQSSGTGRVNLLWGTTLGFDATDPAWTKDGARFFDGDILTATVDQGDVNHTQVPYTPGVNTSVSMLIRLRPPLLQPACHLTDLGGFGLGLLQDGTLSWWVGSDHYATGTALAGSSYVHLIATSTILGVRMWVNGQMVAFLPISNPAAPSHYLIGGPGATFDLASVTLYNRAVPPAEIPQIYVFNQLISSRLGLPDRFWAGGYGVLTYNVNAYGSGYQDVIYPGVKGYLPFTKTFTIGNTPYTLSYYEVTT